MVAAAPARERLDGTDAAREQRSLCLLRAGLADPHRRVHAGAGRKPGGALRTDPAEQTLDKLRALLGGHPYLLRLALSEAYEQGLEISDLLEHLGANAGVFTSHLLQLRKSLQAQPALLAALGSVLMDPRSPLDFPEYCALYSKGLLLEDEPGIYRIRCKLYADYFGALCKKR